MAAFAAPLEDVAGCPVDASALHLTSREAEVLSLIAEGYTTACIAQLLAYSESTIKQTIQAVMRRLGARNRSQVIAIGIRARLI